MNRRKCAIRFTEKYILIEKLYQVSADHSRSVCLVRIEMKLPVMLGAASYYYVIEYQLTFASDAGAYLHAGLEICVFSLSRA